MYIVLDTRPITAVVHNISPILLNKMCLFDLIIFMYIHNSSIPLCSQTFRHTSSTNNKLLGTLRVLNSRYRWLVQIVLNYFVSNLNAKSFCTLWTQIYCIIYLINHVEFNSKLFESNESGNVVK